MSYQIKSKTLEHRHESWVVNPPVYEWDLPEIIYTYEYVLTITFDSPFTHEEWNAIHEACISRWVTRFRHKPCTRMVGCVRGVDSSTVRVEFTSDFDRSWAENRIRAELAKLTSASLTLGQPAQSPA